jgi:hypothetical protein
MVKKKYKSEKIYALSNIDKILWGNNFDTIIKELGKLSRQYKKKGFKHLTLEYYAEYEGGYYEVWGERLETDSEYLTRISREAKIAKTKAAKESAQLEKEKLIYENLKKKFGNA